MNKELDVNFEPLPGYRLIEHLGSGGYGEVWRAEAPGGLTKAIKFVFGQQHEKRATNELRALDHVRGVRHPFLLSLERIEVVDGRLLVVTELADGSVKDRFDACRREGLRGIPRDELLRYLRDAADALDFMSESHQLQHLDIKPENLLLLSDHVKVADFGLVKDVRQSQASMVGGMTPLYAAPEVFRGTPSRHSDQYSLAIVYQEMVSGALPFVGSNAAELTLQHLNDEPDLTPLPAADRYAVSRALSKDPAHRFATCREFVETLLRVSFETTSAVPSAAGSEFMRATRVSDNSSRETIPADMFDAGEPAGWDRAPESVLVDCLPAPGKLVDLPPIDLNGRDPRLVPTLVLGIGGSAGRVLLHLKNKIQHQFGNVQLPAVQFLWLDTDSRAQSEANRGDSGLTPDEMLNLPLRRPQHYRENSQQLLNWISRRWLYNIPRSLRTEGLRPLGRLALADHARQTGQRIRRSMTQALESESIKASYAATQQEFRNDALRVCVVASISGGTGSGMSLDLGYAVRAILGKLGVKNAHLCGYMLHSTGRDARQSELGRVNAFSWLTEFNHYQQSQEAYPGDASCGLPAHSAGTQVFDDTYLLHLGENLDNTDFEQATQSVADYLFLNALTPASGFFEASRLATHDRKAPSISHDARVRSFGLYRRTAAPNEFCEEFASIITQQVLTNWRGDNRGNSTNFNAKNAKSDIKGAAGEFVRRLQLDAAGVVGNGRALLQLQLGGDATKLLTAWFDKHSNGCIMDDRAQVQTIDRMFDGIEPGNAPAQELTQFGQPVAAVIQPLTSKLQTEVQRWITGRVDDPRERIVGARQATVWLGEHLSATAMELDEFRSAVIHRLMDLRSAANPIEPSTGDPLNKRPGDYPSALALDYLSARLDHAAVIAADHALRAVVADTKAMSDDVFALGREIEQIASAVERAANAVRTESPTGTGADVGAQLVAGLQNRLPEIALSVDSRLQSEYIQMHGGLAKTVMQGGRPRAQLAAKLHEFSRQAVQQALSRVNVLEDALGGGGSGAQAALRSALASATPAVLEFGGTRRVLAVLPAEAARQVKPDAFNQALGVSVTTVAGCDNSLTLCVEADELSVAHIAVELVERRRDRIEFAQRVHCRTDISWAPLIAMSTTPADSDPWGDVAIPQTQPQDAVCKTMVM